jgi:hypothetical protein
MPERRHGQQYSPHPQTTDHGVRATPRCLGLPGQGGDPWRQAPDEERVTEAHHKEHRRSFSDDPEDERKQPNEEDTPGPPRPAPTGQAPGEDVDAEARRQQGHEDA